MVFEINVSKLGLKVHSDLRLPSSLTTWSVNPLLGTGFHLLSDIVTPNSDLIFSRLKLSTPDPNPSSLSVFLHLRSVFSFLYVTILITEKRSLLSSHVFQRF